MEHQEENEHVDNPLHLLRDEDGVLPPYAWPGGYPIVYLCGEGCSTTEAMCPGCANGENGSLASTQADDDQWILCGYFIHYEGPPEICCHCGKEIPSAYGDPYEEE